MNIHELFAMFFIIAGCIFVAIAIIGVIKFPDFYTRLHAAGIGDTIGALFIFIGMIIIIGFKLLSIKLLLIFLILTLTNPLATNLMMIGSVRKYNYQKYNDCQPKEK